jgi:hypothetical protein
MPLSTTPITITTFSITAQSQQLKAFQYNNTFLLSVILPADMYVITQSVVMLSVVMLSVLASTKGHQGQIL